MAKSISIIIPTYNEAENIVSLVAYLKNNSNNFIAEIIVSDGNSNDNTVQLAATAGAITVISPQKGRAAQMNHGALLATGHVLYFVHADTLPPKNFAADIITAVQNNFSCGRYRTKFNSSKWLLKINAWFTRFDWFICYGGDQTFFITKDLFNALDGFKETMQIMEEYDLTARAKQKGKYKIFKATTLVSARKYEGISWWQVQMANRKAIALFKKGVSQSEIASTYRAMLNKNK